MGPPRRVGQALRMDIDDTRARLILLRRALTGAAQG